jgi:hypothetical protein
MRDGGVALESVQLHLDIGAAVRGGILDVDANTAPVGSALIENRARITLEVRVFQPVNSFTGILILR